MTGSTATVDAPADTDPPALARAVRGALAVTAGTAAGGVLGLLFWVVAARLYSPDELGRDALLLALVQSIAAATDLNLNSSLPRLLPQAGSARTRLVVGAYAGVALAGIAATAGFVLLAPYLPAAIGSVVAGWPMALALAIGVVTWGIFALQDSVLVAVRRPLWVPAESVAFGVGKIVLAVAFAWADVPHGLFLAWVVAAALLVVPITAVPVRSGLRHFTDGALLRIKGAAPTRAVLVSFLAYDYAALLVQQAGVLLLPLLVTAILGPAANAAFAICFTTVFVAEAILLGIGNSLTVEAAAHPERATELVRAMARRTFLVVTPLSVTAALAAPIALRVFGSGYAEHATTMRLLLLSAVPLCVLVLRTALWRLDGHAPRILWLQIAVLAAVVALLIPLMPAAGLGGVAGAWLGGQALVAAALAPSLMSRLSHGKAGSPTR